MSIFSNRLSQVAASAALTVACALAAPPSAQALPSQLTVQGSLSTSAGAPANGSYDLLVSLYDAQGSGASFWDESHSVVVVDGIFDVVLGLDVGNPLTIADFADTDEVWLGLQLLSGPGVPAEGEPELPRRVLSSVGYAFAAGWAQTATSADSALSAGALSCTNCVTLDHLDFDPATQAELDALSVPTSVDGLAGGNITSGVTVDGSVAATAVRQNGNQVCDTSGNCGPTLAGLMCGGSDGVAAYDSTMGAWVCSADGGTATSASDLECSGCVGVAELDFDPVTADELMMVLGDYALANDLPPEPPSCSGADEALQWNGDSFVCVDTTPAPPTCDGANDALRWDGSGWTCATIPTTPPKCDGPFQALQFDGTDWTCAVIMNTGLSDGQAKGFEARDSWGYAWDGIERQSATWAQASMNCQQLGGRLPTLTELYRVSGGGTSEVGNSYTNNNLWTRTQWSATQHGRVRLTDGRTQGQTSTSSGAYRCVWPNNSDGAFVGNHCYGPPGDECFTAGGGQTRYNVDTWNRPFATYMAVTDECNFYHAHLPDRADFDELIGIAGLPNGAGTGSDGWMYTSDASQYNVVDVIRWSGSGEGYNPASGTYSSWAGKTNAYRFRCKGVGYAAGIHPNAVAGGFVADSTYVTLDGEDQNAAGGVYAAAVTDCFDRGGHVATQRDFEEAVRAGAGRSPTTAWLWTSDASEYRYNNVVQWSGTSPSFQALYSGEATWAGRFNAYAHRCAYYPIDADYVGPSQCVNGFNCFTIERGEQAKVKLWADPADRSPATYMDALTACHDEGGRLATSRDYTELVRAGLGLGSTAWLWTSDAAGNTGTNQLVVRWDGTETDFDLDYSGNATWQSKSTGNQSPYRCVWTNELR